MGYTPDTDLDGRRVDLGSVSLGRVDAAGVAWHLQEMEGWDGSEVRAEYQVREYDHGAWAAPVYLSERPITLAGKVVAPDLIALDGAMEQLRAAAALSATTLTVYETIPKQVTVRRSGKPLIRPLSDKVAEFSLLVTAADPRRYATVLQSQTTGLPVTTGGPSPPLTPPITLSASSVTGTINAENVGTIDCPPVFTIAGPVTAPLILVQQPDGSVQSLSYSQDLQAGEVLVINCNTRTVVLDGTASRRRYLSVPLGWPLIPCGGTATIQFQSTVYDAAAMITAEWRSAWL
ncbi:hypothetical protein ACFVZH_20980 [Streptomyces sp. NPDC059534]|uniref:phage distal tail protein n=1 Tax=Streptomyces sp. NPDC059534 TaxID=3346859 RepID=UPI0036A639BA